MTPRLLKILLFLGVAVVACKEPPPHTEFYIVACSDTAGVTRVAKRVTTQAQYSYRGDSVLEFRKGRKLIASFPWCRLYGTQVVPAAAFLNPNLPDSVRRRFIR